ncbi:DNA primase DnaG [Saccharolobus caldissimus]|uniref:DNA primase DnaG n=1 Tax=Saccharolobus caldissimus TaxID=1702097 RepID=A0AAQ4CWR5_9CREN|nr:DNA primase DnaG [Saccharolobus caldissimus]BDC00247.1 DNA primase [Saccharolobus caldissimus]
MKYNVKLKFEVDGIVEKTDVIGAIFGQTENLFGDEFDLRELQDKGRLGRIIVEVRSKGGKSEGEVIIPSNLDRIETALIAAMIESVDKVGPYNSKFELIEIEDIRAEKLKKIIERAKNILSSWSRERSLDIKEVLNEISSAVKVAEITEYGPEKLPAGPDVDKDPNLIIVEGRADVINLLRYGYKNVIAIEGATSRVPETIINLSKTKKTVIAFLDGDHGGDLILKELLSNNVKIDFVARAPVGREVEELTGKEISKALSNMMPLTQYLKKLQESQPLLAETVTEEKPKGEIRQAERVVQISLPQSVVEDIKKLPGTLEGFLYDNNWNVIEKVQVRDIIPKLENYQENKVAYIVFDGVITQRLLDLASQKNIKMIIGARIGGINKRPPNVDIITFSDIISS